MKLLVLLRLIVRKVFAIRSLTMAAAFVLLLTFVITEPSLAQQAPASSNEDRETIKQLLKRVEGLESRIKELEAKQTKAAPSTGKDDEAVAEKQEADSHSAHGASDRTPGSAPSLQIRGFGDVVFHATDEKGETNSFVLGQLDLFITSRLSDKLSVLGELVLEANDENEFGFEVERFLLQYSHSDYLKLAIGRYHTSIGYYNTAFHHGTWFQTATGRPFIFEFEDEGGILPIHNVGLAANGRIPSGNLGLQYFAEVGNGRASRSPLDEAVQSVVDENNRKAVNFGLLARPNWVPGLQAGFSIYRDRLAPEGLPRINETILAAHAIYQNAIFELLNEGLIVRHALKGAAKLLNTAGFYTQISRLFGKTRPYFRYQYTNAPDDDPIFSDVGRRNGPSVGLRFDVSEFAAFKAQYDRTARRQLNSINGLTLQMAFTF